MELRVMLVVTFLHVNDLGRTLNLSFLHSPQRFELAQVSSFINCLFLPFLIPRDYDCCALTTWRSQQFCEYTKLCHTSVPLLTLFPLPAVPFPRLLLLHLGNCAGPSRFGMITLAEEDASSLCFNITLSILNIYFRDFFLMSYMRAEMSRSYFCVTRISHSAWHGIRAQ